MSVLLLSFLLNKCTENVLIPNLHPHLRRMPHRVSRRTNHPCCVELGRPIFVQFSVAEDFRFQYPANSIVIKANALGRKSEHIADLTSAVEKIVSLVVAKLAKRAFDLHRLEAALADLRGPFLVFW